MRDNLLLVHKGALGDFLQIWPSVVSIIKKFPSKTIFWGGKEEFYFFLEPLGIKKIDLRLKLELDKIYTDTKVPESLKEFDIIWFGLLKPPSEYSFSNLHFVQGLSEGILLPPRELYLRELKKKIGISPYYNWHKEWINIFSKYKINEFPYEVLIFPGSGHLKKCWDLENFMEIAKWLNEIGFKVLFILGPVEKERKIEVKKFEHLYVMDLKELISIICSVKMVVGNDSGPIHLSGYMGIPTIAIFGPTPPEIWGPYNGEVVYKKIKCSPCSFKGEILCEDPLCLKNIIPEEVKEKIKNFSQGRSLEISMLKTCLEQKEEGYKG